MKINRWRMGILLGAVGLLTISLLLPSMIKRARLSEGKVNLASMIAAQKAFHDEYETFSVSLENIGFKTEKDLRGYLVITDKDLHPQDILRIPAEMGPFVEKNRFRILYVMPDAILMGTESGIQEIESLQSRADHFQ